MSWWIQDYDETQIFITDLWREWFITKFNINKEFPIVGDEVLVIWTDIENGGSEKPRILPLNYNDVVTGYGGYLSNPSSAEQLREVLLSYIPSAWQNLQDQINSMGGIGDLVVNTSYLNFSDPNLDFSTRSKAAVDHFLFLHKI